MILQTSPANIILDVSPIVPIKFLFAGTRNASFPEFEYKKRHMDFFFHVPAI